MDIKALTESEKITMKCVWDLGDGCRLAHILEKTSEVYKKKWKSQTVSTFLGKLVSKGYVEQYRQGRYYCYRILISEHEYRCYEILMQMRFWENGNMELFAERLMDGKTFSDAERKVLLQCMNCN